jgi:Domain of unknown function (DUF6867)
MEAVLGTSIWGTSIWVVILWVLMAFAAFMTGQALANTWKPIWHAIVYSVLLGFADRFLTFALYEGELLSLNGYLVDTAVLLVVALFAFRISQARKMVSQYPWLYEETGLFGWRQKGPERPS